MQQLLVAGPTKARGPASRVSLEIILENRLNSLARDKELVVAQDTVTGAIAWKWAFYHKRPCRRFSAGLALPSDEAKIDHLGREAILNRNLRMLSEPFIDTALLFIESRECSQFIEVIRSIQKPIEIIRVLA